jgi:hypothetical protein
VLGRVWKQTETRENCTFRLFIMCTANKEDESAVAENISGKDKNRTKYQSKPLKGRYRFRYVVRWKEK